jgi:2'-5' RNA ligase
MKLFYALWPDAGTRATLADEDRTLFAGNGGKMVPPDEYHLTINYLGEIDDAKLPALEELGQRAASTAPSSVVELDRVEWWQESKVLVRCASVTPEPLIRVDNALSVGLKAAGVVQPARPLKLHLTMVRNIRPHPLGTGAVPPLAWSADSLALVQSVSGPGQRYHLLGQWPFAKPM